MTYRIHYAYVSHIGNVRDNNEDNFWCCKATLSAENRGTEGKVRSGDSVNTQLPVFSVFDGMGGESCGEMAAYAAAESFGRYYEREKTLLRRNPALFVTESCREMNRAVCTYQTENKIRSMGTTLAMVAFGQKAVYACNLGDSRIYHIYGGKLARVSADHLAKAGFLGKGVLVQYLGMEEKQGEPEPYLVEIPYQADSRYLLCSDGVTDMLTEEEIRETLEQYASAEEAVKALLALALEKGGRDNATAVLCEVKAEETGGGLRNWLKNVISRRQADEKSS